jgi:hypothetical protein
MQFFVTFGSENENNARDWVDAVNTVQCQSQGVCGWQVHCGVQVQANDFICTFKKKEVGN